MSNRLILSIFFIFIIKFVFGQTEFKHIKKSDYLKKINDDTTNAKRIKRFSNNLFHESNIILDNDTFNINNKLDFNFRNGSYISQFFYKDNMHKQMFPECYFAYLINNWVNDTFNASIYVCCDSSFKCDTIDILGNYYGKYPKVITRKGVSKKNNILYLTYINYDTYSPNNFLGIMKRTSFQRFNFKTKELIAYGEFDAVSTNLIGINYFKINDDLNFIIFPIIENKKFQIDIYYKKINLIKQFIVDNDSIVSEISFLNDPKINCINSENLIENLEKVEEIGIAFRIRQKKIESINYKK